MALETMNTGAMRSLSAMFDSRMAADRAVSALKAAGIADVVLTGGENEGYGSRQYSVEDRSDRGFFESIGDFFFPEEDRYAYAEGLNRGGYLVTVSNIASDQYETALDILDDEGAVDLDAREAEWRQEGWSGYDPALGDTTAYAAERVETDTYVARDRAPLEGDLNDDGRIDVVEERLLVSKREAEGGRDQGQGRRGLGCRCQRRPLQQQRLSLRRCHLSRVQRPGRRRGQENQRQNEDIEQNRQGKGGCEDLRNWDGR